ncbi:alanine--tRNA ligase [Dethiobacter alkaliphilus]|uniref:Alanine--tRNA ligase n=1 Tax=Dethiobacter alkaliphilus AHT 1 TaxID=555088 RepID=C0GKI5_DETAL|nr:alanine--tRNA ligase [Dethiobacter alkaliphilus]EEG76152.1 alanyl-tRNA synthetase [Dethiobacter alkaliphilus AHT 1]
MKSKEIRSTFLEFFKGKEHLVLPSFSLIPQNDPTLLMVGAGMAPLKPYFTGEKTPPKPRVATCQKCVRTPDIERVGRTSRHATFFEMLGNFSFGDYFKEEAILWAWELVTTGYKLPEDKLYVSVYLDDDEAYDIWHKKVGIAPERIFRLGKEDNFWEIGQGPCGPCSEIYYDLGADRGCGRPNCEVGCDCDRFLEVWNLVFTQFNCTESGEYVPLTQKNIDTGAGLERLAVVLQGVNNLFEIDTVRPLLDHFSKVTKTEYGKDQEKDTSLRIITEHLRGISFMVGDGILPGNEGRGYVLRRLLRRAVRHGKILGVGEPFLHNAVNLVVDEYGEFYPELAKGREYIQKVVRLEEERFHETLEQGMKILDELMHKAGPRGVLPGDAAFKLYDTYGFPIDLTKEILAENKLILDEEGYQEALEAQRERARSARGASVFGKDDTDYESLRQLTTEFTGYDSLEAEGEVLAILKDGQPASAVSEGDEAEVVLSVTPFYGERGGQAGDTGIIITDGGTMEVTDTVMTPFEQVIHRGSIKQGTVSVGDAAKGKVFAPGRSSICRNHTATHLIHTALQEVLGEHVKQAGSLVTPDRLRFDFTNLSAATPEQLAEVEQKVNEKIWANEPVSVTLASLDEAKDMGATALFDEKYGDAVRIVRVGDYSMELCGGTHVQSAGEIGLLKIVSEAGIGAGMRRIEALTGAAAYRWFAQRNQLLEQCAAQLKSSPEQLPERISGLQAEFKDLQREYQRLQLKLAGMEVDGLLSEVSQKSGVPVLSARVSAGNMETLREMADRLKNKLGSGIIILGAAAEGKVLLVGAVTNDLVKAGYHAGKLVGEVAKLTGGGGGGRPDMAQAGGKDPDKLESALEKVDSLVENQKK